MLEKVFKKGDVIIREGEHDESLFQVISGSADVIVNIDTPEAITLTTLTAGKYFGELAMLVGVSHTASVCASEDDTKVLVIPYDEIQDYAAQKPELTMDLMKSIGGRIRLLTADYEEARRALDQLRSDAPKDDGLFGKLRKYIRIYRNNKKASQVSSESLREQKGIDHNTGFRGNTVSYPAGTVICKEDEIGNCMYDIHSGKVGVYTGYGTPKEKLLTELFPNTFFGEMGMIDQEARSATCVALADDTVLEIITPEGLEELAVKNPPKLGMILEHLALRLRRLTNDYVAVCKQIAEATPEA